jgi:hypothetical protein
VSKGFADAAFAAFSRRRSTVREDIAQSFAATPPAGEEGAAGQYVEMLNQPSSEAKEAPARRGGRSSGIVDVTPRGRGRAPRGTRGRPRGSEGLKEI